MPKKRKKGAPRREMLLLCFLSALDVRRLKVVTLCFVTLNVFIEHCCWAGNGSQGCQDNDPSAQGLENPMDGGAWWATVHGGAKSQTRLSNFHFSFLCTGEGNGNPLQCSCLENPRDRGAWWTAVYVVAQSRTRLK
jgi:hypothetical protein